jgi:hypothetical protein
VAFPIALEEMEAAYAATGLVPAAGCYIAGDRAHACPLGAGYVRRHASGTIARAADCLDVFGGIRSALGLTYDQAADFTLGFDGEGPEGVEDFDAYAAGQAARAHFLPLQPPEA